MAEQSCSGGIGLPSFLTIIFVIMKCTGYIGWSWWWVFSPLWISTSLFLLIVLTVLVIVGFDW